MEARLDMLLAEELQVNAPFAGRFVALAAGSTSRSPLALPASDPDAVTVVCNGWEDIEDGGENDLDVLVRWESLTVRVIVEDKVWAPFQPRQAERYRARADL